MKTFNRTLQIENGEFGIANSGFRSLASESAHQSRRDAGATTRERQCINSGAVGNHLRAWILFAILTPVSWLLTPCALRAQQYQLGLSGNFYLSTTPASASDLDILIGSGSTWSYNTIEIRPLSLTNAVISARTGVEHVLYTSPSGRVVLNADANVGIATSNSTTAAAAAGGGNVMIKLMASKPVYLTIGGELDSSPTIPGTYEGQAKIGFRWQLTPAAQ